MAENAAHITSSLQTKPSIFEVIAQDSLSELLQPSFKIIVQFLGLTNPQRYQWLSDSFEEVFLLFSGLLQLHYLNNKEASFSESFYGLKRVLSSGNNGRLSNRAKFWSLFCLVGLPYLSRKAEQYIAKHQHHKVADVCYRSVVAGWRTALLVQYLMYLTGRAAAHSPLLSVANLCLHYCPEETHSSYSWRDCFTNGRACKKLISESLIQGFEFAAFFLQCLQWWHSDEMDHTKLPIHVPTPPPLSIVEAKERSTSNCPVCKDPCKIETVLITSGYVFCYRCVREAITTKQQCPVTGLPATLDELIRIYPSK